jgi:NADPH:quinone reductase-like Zn-dependent oxidoreductase
MAPLETLLLPEIPVKTTAIVKMLRNTAAWLEGPKTRPLVVKEAPYPSPGADELVIETHAVAINPIDFMIQDHDPPVANRAIQYPTILGADIAGIIVSVGQDVKTRKVGERIVVNAPGIGLGKPSMSAFQHFVVAQESLAIPVPTTTHLVNAVVLPLACYTAAAGLFVTGQLGLSTHGLGNVSATPPPLGSVLLVWGGSSSVGCCAIQMARAAGYEVYTVAGKWNHELCLSIGATKVFDRANEDVERLIVEALVDKVVVGALDCIAHPEFTINACVRILARAVGRKKVMTVLTPPQTESLDGVEIQRGETIPAGRYESWKADRIFQ